MILKLGKFPREKKELKKEFFMEHGNGTCGGYLT